MVERQSNPLHNPGESIANHVQDLQQQAGFSRGEPGRFTFHSLEDNSKVWRFETKIDGEKVALVFPPKHLEKYISVSREELKNRLGQFLKNSEPEEPKEKIHFNTPNELEDWLSQNSEETSKAVLHFKTVDECRNWLDQHPEYRKENSKFEVDVEEPLIARVPLGPLTREEIDHVKELFKKTFGSDFEDSEVIVKYGRERKDAPSDQSPIDIRFHLRGGTDSPPESH